MFGFGNGEDLMVRLIRTCFGDDNSPKVTVTIPLDN